MYILFASIHCRINPRKHRMIADIIQCSSYPKSGKDGTRSRDRNVERHRGGHSKHHNVRYALRSK